MGERLGGGVGYVEWKVYMGGPRKTSGRRFSSVDIGRLLELKLGGWKELFIVCIYICIPHII